MHNSPEPYHPDHLSSLLETWERASRIAHPFFSASFLESERQAIADQWIPIAESWVFLEDGRCIAFISMIENEIGGLFVHPDQQRRGLGGRLVDHVAATREILEVEVFEANRIGLAFYHSYGFKDIGRNTHEPSGELVLRMRYLQNN